MPIFLAPPTDSPDELRRLRTVWRFLIFGIGFVVCQIVLGIGVAIVWLIVLLARGELRGPLDPAKLETMIQGSVATLSAASAVPSAALSLGLCLLCRRFLDRRPVASMGLVRLEHGLTTGILPGFLMGLLPITAGALGLCAVGAYQFHGFALPVSALWMAPAFIFLAFQEELVFRGYLYQNLIDIHRDPFGLVFTSLVFWIVHGFNPNAWSSPLVSINLFGAGVVLATAYRLSRNIWFPTAMHFAWNFAQGVLFSIPVSGMPLDGFVRLERNESRSDLLTGGEFGLEGSLVSTILEVVMFVILIGGMRLRRQEVVVETEVPGGEDIPDGE